ncbi:hypothetical protein N7519_005262 [Penicillium mononematosum]|uniref:uncharacterized protein n=1 Tax=Penicillium mononematosum TaxID=268346 RepID=UPI0025498818|nr:uncharacterized protein N7519_005262 [Penicillium mononematosum]KAJ6183961.1 hypothetical protein N7519_005262 [Penicillium mononematosum]
MIKYKGKSKLESCDIVIASAGLSRASDDDLWPLDINVSLIGTKHICMHGNWRFHYFHKQPDTEVKDTFVLLSLAVWSHDQLASELLPGQQMYGS